MLQFVTLFRFIAALFSCYYVVSEVIMSVWLFAMIVSDLQSYGTILVSCKIISGK